MASKLAFLLLLVFGVAAASADQSFLSVYCTDGSSWKSGNNEVTQYNCYCKLDGGYKGPWNNAVCVKLGSDGFQPVKPCGQGSPECSWNVNPDWSSPHPLYPGSVWAFGLQTLKGKPNIYLGTYKPAINGVCTW